MFPRTCRWRAVLLEDGRANNGRFATVLSVLWLLLRYVTKSVRSWMAIAIALLRPPSAPFGPLRPAASPADVRFGAVRFLRNRPWLLSSCPPRSSPPARHLESWKRKTYSRKHAGSALKHRKTSIEISQFLGRLTVVQVTQIRGYRGFG